MFFEFTLPDMKSNLALTQHPKTPPFLHQPLTNIKKTPQVGLNPTQGN